MTTLADVTAAQQARDLAAEAMRAGINNCGAPWDVQGQLLDLFNRYCVAQISVLAAINHCSEAPSNVNNKA